MHHRREYSLVTEKLHPNSSLPFSSFVIWAPSSLLHISIAARLKIVLPQKVVTKFDKVLTNT